MNELKCHEEIINQRSDKLYEYLLSLEESIYIPSIIIDSNTFTIIDGHHRYKALQRLNIDKITCTLIDYLKYKNNIIVNPNTYFGLTHLDVINSAINKTLLKPKSTQHMVKNKITNELEPIIVLSKLIKI